MRDLNKEVMENEMRADLTSTADCRLYDAANEEINEKAKQRIATCPSSGSWAVQNNDIGCSSSAPERLLYTAGNILTQVVLHGPRNQVSKGALVTRIAIKEDQTCTGKGARLLYS